MAQAGLTPIQCRVARTAAGWSQEELAKAADVSRPVVQDFERGDRIPMVNNLRAIRAALESRRVRFLGSADGVATIAFADDEAK